MNVSSNVGFGKKDTLRLSATYGEGIENYMCQRLQKSVMSVAANGLLKFSGTVMLHSRPAPMARSANPEKFRNSHTPAAKA